MNTTTIALAALALTTLTVAAQHSVPAPENDGTARYQDLHLILPQGKVQDARILVFSNDTKDLDTTCVRIMGVALVCYTAQHNANGSWTVTPPWMAYTTTFPTYSQAHAFMIKSATNAVAHQLNGIVSWSVKDAAPLSSPDQPREYVHAPQIPPEPRRVRVYVSRAGGVEDGWLYDALKRDVARKYPLESDRDELCGGPNHNGLYWIGFSGTTYSEYTLHGQQTVESPMQTCKAKNVEDCAKEAFDYLDAVIQHDNGEAH